MNSNTLRPLGGRSVVVASSLLVVIALLAAATIMTIAPQVASATTYTSTFATWTSDSTGTLGSTTFVVTSPEVTALATYDLSTADFVPAGSASQDMLNFGSGAPILFTFAAPVTNPAFYFRYLRGPAGPDSYDFTASGGTCTWSIVSGLSDVTLIGSTLTPGATYGNGIVLCAGTVSAFGLVPNPTSLGSVQALDLALLTEVVPPTTTTTTTTSTTAPEAPIVPAITG